MIHPPLSDQTLSVAVEKSCKYSPLKYQRLLRGWSQEELAAQIYALCAAEGKTGVGIGVHVVSKWERGVSKPSPLYRKHLCQLYGMNAEQLGFI